MSRVRIYVVAGPNMGKTTIAHVIKDALETHDFRKVVLQDTKPSTEAKQPIEQRVQATKERPVSIEVVSIASDPTSAVAVPSIMARAWLSVIKDVRTLTASDNTYAANKLKDLDAIIEELQLFTR